MHFFSLHSLCTDVLKFWPFFISQVFNFERVKSRLEPLHIQSDLSLKEMLDRVLRLPSVASKRYLTNKVIK